jgi:hypothetical protein
MINMIEDLTGLSGAVSSRGRMFQTMGEHRQRPDLARFIAISRPDARRKEDKAAFRDNMDIPVFCKARGAPASPELGPSRQKCPCERLPTALLRVGSNIF